MVESNHHTTQRSGTPSRRPKKPANPLVKGILAYCSQHDVEISEVPRDRDIQSPNLDREGHDLAVAEPTRTKPSKLGPFYDDSPSPRLQYRSLSRADIPKRYTIYAPLVLLPSNFSSQNPRWAEFYRGLNESERTELFRCIAEEGFAGTAVEDRTGIRIAILAPIAAEEAEIDGHRESTVDETGLLKSGLPTYSTTVVTMSEAKGMHDPTKSKSVGTHTTASTRKQNVLRSPSGLVPVYGDWGKILPRSWSHGSGLGCEPCSANEDRSRKIITNPSQQNFQEAFWTSTSQHKGITQCWAPLYTMFSRGNISEKARILGVVPKATVQSQSASKPQPDSQSPAETFSGTVTQPQSTFPGLTDAEFGEPLSSIDVVDFYVGIGYFAFCYLARGVRRVWGWDINPWSIEGLRRGCEKNGWGCMVVRVDDDGRLDLPGNGTNATEDRLEGDDVVKEVVARIRQGDEADTERGPGRERQDQHAPVRCIAFLGDNKWSDTVMGKIQREMQHQGLALNVKHANLGLLPTSRGSWQNAVKVVKGQQSRTEGRRGGWLHVHENVDIQHIEAMKNRIIQDLDSIVRHEPEPEPAGQEEDGSEAICVPSWSVSCDQIHQVKTYAPGVMHCVFDIHITPNG
ncbi:hypothetical protein A1O1_02478 [Capronia coronata CBS 617.96]|uniref:tRNA(Phe) (4-demethylwyosine(37)-C(7)) aminocarboxypropyltransferase n=1 Tax=Capronia coronata CBS 617.96 TaxID=1182541 RepID=W9YWM6_9EURO|nr:uncharacterized protein A1O1_02478 [Capronia coronata CBS 617.96]EXJ94085.1 hypothetical protein A1O1_02478 [Capronia coronata CBS 617.96]